MGFLKKRIFLIVCVLFFFTLVLRIHIGQEFSETPYFNFTLKTVTGPDQNTFFEWGLALSEGRWEFRRLQAGEPFYVAPLYALLIALSLKITGSIGGILFLQALLSSFLVFIFYDLGRRLGRPWAGVIAAALWCLYGPAYYYDACVIRASLIASLTFLLAWAVMAAGQKRLWPWVGAGSLSGILAVLRPHLFFLFLPLWTAWHNRRASSSQSLIQAALVLGVAALVVLPVTVRNYAASGRLVPISAQGADAFWLGNAPDTLGVGFFPTKRSLELKIESRDSVFRSLPILMRELVRDPAAYARLYARKARMFLNDFEIPANYSFYVFRRITPLSGVPFLTFLWILPLAAVGLWSVFRRREPVGTLVFFLLVLSFSALVIHIQSRYRYPVMPFFIFFAGAGVAELAFLIRAKNAGRLAAAIIVMAGFFWAARPLPSYGVLTHQDPDGRQIRVVNPIRDVDYITWITAYFFADEKKYRKEINALFKEARSFYGKEFGTKFLAAIAQLKGS